jgi:hypothetical protein
MKLHTLPIMLLCLIFCVSATNHCHGTDLTTHFYPVKDQPFLLPLSAYFNATGIHTYTSEDPHFHVQQTVVRGEAMQFASKEVTSVLKMAHSRKNYAILASTEKGFAVFQSTEG